MPKRSSATSPGAERAEADADAGERRRPQQQARHDRDPDPRLAAIVVHAAPDPLVRPRHGRPPGHRTARRATRTAGTGGLCRRRPRRRRAGPRLGTARRAETLAAGDHVLEAEHRPAGRGEQRDLLHERRRDLDRPVAPAEHRQPRREDRGQRRELARACAPVPRPSRRAPWPRAGRRTRTPAARRGRCPTARRTRTRRSPPASPPRRHTDRSTPSDLAPSRIWPCCIGATSRRRSVPISRSSRMPPATAHRDHNITKNTVNPIEYCEGAGVFSLDPRTCEGVTFASPPRPATRLPPRRPGRRAPRCRRCRRAAPPKARAALPPGGSGVGGPGAPPPIGDHPARERTASMSADIRSAAPRTTSAAANALVEPGLVSVRMTGLPPCSNSRRTRAGRPPRALPRPAGAAAAPCRASARRRGTPAPPRGSRGPARRTRSDPRR